MKNFKNKFMKLIYICICTYYLNYKISYLKGITEILWYKL